MAIPEQSTHQFARLPVAGSMTLPSYLQTGTGMKYYNCMPRTIKQNGRDPVRILEKRGDYTQLTTGVIPSGDFALRGAFTSVFISSTYIVLALSSNVYINATSSMTLVHSTGYVGFTDARIGDVNYIVALENHDTAARLHVFNIQTLTDTVINLAVGASGDPVFLNGRIYVAGWRNQRIYNSAVGNLTSWTPANDYIDAEQVGDIVITLGLHRNHLVAFGTHSVEFFQDVGYEIGSPLLRQETYASLIGMQIKTSGVSMSMLATIGNDTYFNGDIGGTNCILRLRDFKITKVSDPYLDRILNNGLIYPGACRIFPVMNFGRPFVLFAAYFSDTNSYIMFAYSVEEETWAEWEPPNIGVTFSPHFGILRKTLSDGSHHSILVGTINGFARVFGLLSTNQSTSSPSGNDITSYMIFDTFDGGTEFQKHIKAVDVVGDLGDNAVTLSFTKDASKNSTSYTLANDGAGAPMRFRNLCRAKRVNFKITFTGKTQIEFRGLDVYYNLGTH